MLYNFSAVSFYTLKLCSRLFVLHCRSRPKYDNARHFDFLAEFLLSVIELLFLSLTVEVLQGKICQNSLPSGVVGHLEPKFQGRGRPWGIFFGFCKTRHILLSHSANHRATCRRFDTIPACDGQRDGIAVASTALAMRALRHAVKTKLYSRFTAIMKTTSVDIWADI